MAHFRHICESVSKNVTYQIPSKWTNDYVSSVLQRQNTATTHNSINQKKQKKNCEIYQNLKKNQLSLSSVGVVSFVFIRQNSF